MDSIAEISSDFIQCYEVNAGRVAMLEGFNTPDGKMEKIYFSEENKDQILALLQDVEGFDKSYLRLSVGKERETSKGYFILRHKLTGKDISEESYSGQRYLRAGHNKNSQMVTVPTVLNMYIWLLIKNSICSRNPILLSLLKLGIQNTFIEACGIYSVSMFHVGASVISLAPTFYASHEKSERVHFAAPPFHLRPASLGSQVVGGPAGGYFSFLAEILVLTALCKRKCGLF